MEFKASYKSAKTYTTKDQKSFINYDILNIFSFLHCLCEVWREMTILQTYYIYG